MNTLSELWTQPAFIWAGWTAVVVLWYSTAAALLFASWCALRGSTTVYSEHQAALVTLGACLLGAVAAPFVLASWPALVEAPAPVSRVGSSLKVAVGPLVAPASSSGALSWNAVAALAGALWAVGSTLMLMKLAGGWLLVRRIRQQAAPLTDRNAAETFYRVMARADLESDVVLLSSTRVEAPVVVGVRRSTLILPKDLCDQLGADALEPLLAHECEHIRRRDYGVNLVQSCIDALLFFSPGVRWVSQVARETREFCCDEAAVRCCHEDRGAYARVLTRLAALGSRNHVRPALGAAGPRLITRVRRLLKEETAPRPVARGILTGMVSALVLLTSAPVLHLSAAQASAVPLRSADTSESGWNVPIGWATRQPGSSVVMGPVLTDHDFLAASVTLRNVADVAVSSVVLAAVVSGSTSDGPGPVAIVTSDPIPVNIPAGATATIPARFMTREQIGRAGQTIGGSRQAFFGLARTVFSNGAEWSTTPNPAARQGSEALSLPPGSVPRSMIAASPRVGPPMAVCADDHGELTSEGGVVAVRDEPGRFAVCRNGSWVNADFGIGASTQPQPGEVPSETPPGALRIVRGSQLTMELADAPPVAVTEVRPKFPREAVREISWGNVILTITVNADGTVGDIVVKKSLTPTLDAEATKAAKQWRFKPATKGGTAVPVQTELEFTFTTR